MKKMTYLLNLTLFVLCTQFVFADVVNDDGGKQMYISFEDAQAALGDKDYFEPGNGSTTRSAPDWEDDPGAYQFTATMAVGIVQNADGNNVAADGDLLAAFGPNGDVQGVAIQLPANFGPYVGQTFYEMQMRSNNPGETISFKYYDASGDQVVDVEETYTFVTNEVLGHLITGAYFLTADISDDPCADGSCDCAGVPGGDSFVDCAGSCTGASYMSWLGDGYCDDGSWGVDFVSCGDFNCV